MKRWLALAAIAPLLAALPARALFHEWDIVEVFSNEDGSIQYVEFFTSFGSQQFLDGHTLRTQINTTNALTYPFDGDLDTSEHGTANQSFLVATAGFEAAAGIAPDYVMPDAFIEVGVVTRLNFENVSIFQLAGLPTDGANALFADASTGPATPTNFAGETGTLPEPGAVALGLVALATLGSMARRAR
jgi:hypothetical protein